MNHFHSVKEEHGDVEVPLPEPMRVFDENAPPPFLTKIYEMVEDPRTDSVISWNRGGKSFVVWDVYAFSTNLLPKYFKHGNFSSFIRQLNTYGFKKIDPGIWEFANESFLKDHKELLRNIKRRRASHHQESHTEIEELQRDKKTLFMELMELKQQQKMNMVQAREMEARLQGTEKNQQQMMSFLARAIENPGFINQLVHGEKFINDFEMNEISRKRRRLIDSHGFQVTELEALALEMQGNVEESDDEEVEGEFWKEMKDEGFDEELSLMLSNMPSFYE